MKKTFLSMVFTLGALHVHAQDEPQASDSRMYFRLGVGYSFAHASQTDMSGAVISGSTSSTTAYTRYQTKKVSFGAGPNATVALGYMLTDNFGLELGVNVGMFARKHTFQTDVFYSADETGVGEGRTYAQTRLTVMPSVVMQAPLARMKVYSRVGLALPVMAKLKREYTEVQTTLGGTHEISNEGEYRTLFAAGLQGALGVQFPMGGVTFWVEANGISMNAYARSFMYDTYTINGTDVLETLPRADKEIEYNFDGTEFSSPSSPDEVGTAKTFSIPFSNIGAAVGFSFDL